MMRAHTFFSICLITAALSVGCNDKQSPEETNQPNEPSKELELGSEPSPEPVQEKKVFVLSNGSSVELIGKDTEGTVGRFLNFVGKFEIADGKILEGGKNFLTIDMSSVATDDKDVGEKLKGEQFFDVEKYPITRFQLKELAPLQTEKEYEVTGILDLHGVSRKVSFPATFGLTAKETLMDLRGELVVNREDFGLSKSVVESIEDQITIRFKVNAMPGEPKDLVLGEVIEPPEVTEVRPTTQGRFGQGKGTGTAMRFDWRNMSEEERAERRRQFIATLDKNGDGNIGKDEVDERMWTFMGRADKNGDNQITPTEGEEYRAELRAQWEIRSLSGEGWNFGGKGGSRDSKGRGGTPDTSD